MRDVHDEIGSRQPYRWGVIGAGWFASRRHIPDILGRTDCELAALCRRDESALSQLASRFSPKAVFTDWRVMLSSCRLDAVLIATPHNLHYEQARTALELGLNVLLEKPMTLKSEEAWDLVRIAAEQGRQLAVALNPPYWAHCHRMRAAVAEGKIGAIEGVSIRWTGDVGFAFGDMAIPENLPGIVPPTLYRSDPDACGGGFLVDSGPHLISKLLWVTGLEAVSVSCQLDAVSSDRRAVLSIALEGDVFASLLLIGNSRSGERRVSEWFAGSAGTIEVEGPEFRTAIRAQGQSQTFTEREAGTVPTPVGNFVDTLAGAASIAGTSEHGARVVDIMAAAYASANEGRVVKLSTPPTRL